MRRRNNAGSTIAKLVLGLLIYWLALSPAWAQEQDGMRGGIGIKLFPALLAADLDLSTRLNEEGGLTVILLYSDNNKVAMQMAARLADNGNIKGYPLSVRVLAWDRLRDHDDAGVLAGIFITEPLVENLSKVIDYSRGHKTLLFSPFAGDVEQGVLAGLEVTDRIRPYLNLQVMRESGIRLKPFFVDVASHYEPE